ncbi:SWIM zinc finger family protein [uncultured Ruminococcus sp.]|uniref:SWIM zinc finger family protein n=1 Tax=uncultured Ruminococcus sp. TaxID=165186 RepID=UPI0025FEE807|nr:SWIM zinc finger family protein [uncultured Ruminococcus sp.]
MTEKVQKLRQLIAAADEDALIGLANKGTYKRACKDAEGLTAEFEEGDDCITLSFGGETVTLKAPLENSTCSCPSRAVCRHIIGPCPRR